MGALRSTAIASTAVAMTVAVAVAATGRAETAGATRQTATPTATPTALGSAGRERPRGVVEDCSTTPGWGRRDEFTRRENLIVGPLAVERGAVVWEYNERVGGDKLFVYVKSGHRVTIELSARTRENAGLVFGHFHNPNVRLHDARRVVRFIACRRGERSGRFDGWPVTGWVGFLLAGSPRCVPLVIWVDEEPSPRRAVIRFGVPDCG